MADSPSRAFTALKQALDSNPALKSEAEGALQLLVDRWDPSDRGNRFVVGAVVEWTIAAIAWQAGILSSPAGHSVNGFDLQDLLNESRSLWSVKSSFQGRAAPFRISNGMGGAGKGLRDPTIFLHPNLPGLVFIDPAEYPEVAREARQSSDATLLRFSVVRDFADAHPEAVAKLAMPRNMGQGTEDAAIPAARDLLASGRFPRLGKMFTDSMPKSHTLVEEILRLKELVETGAITQKQYSAAVGKIVS